MKMRWILGVLAGGGLAVALGAVAQEASPTPTEIKKAGHEAGEAAKDAGKAVGTEAKKVGEATATGAKDAGKAVGEEAKKVGEGARKAGDAAVTGAARGEGVPTPQERVLRA